ncbi:C39 family peptidase [Flavobacteriales bacterium]|nr:C39 family peptidase [Flavobacteriales bacterium]
MKKLLIILLCLPMIGFGQQSRGYEKRPLGVPLGNAAKNNSVLISDVPSYIWHRGCGPTALGMIIGYYDLHGFDDLFQDSTLAQTNDINMSIASEDHYNDYSLPLDYYPNLLQDSSELGIPHQHNSIADFMRTSSSVCGNYWGWSWSSDIGSAFENYVYFRNSNYITHTEYEYFSSNSWDEYKIEIDNNRPVIILVDTDGDDLTDHFVVGIGYDDVSQEFVCYDTWDNNIHSYEWRGMASGINYGIYGFNRFSISNSVTGLDNRIEKEGKYKVIDILGRRTKKVKNKPLFYIYDDGIVEKRIVVE